MVVGMGKLVYGVGINDADYTVSKNVNGKVVWCDFYERWVHMLKRCYSKKYQSKNKTYIGCKVCDEWLTLSKFSEWMKTQNWQGNQLDKDILFQRNKIYSPETCVFVNSITNTFETDREANRGNWPLGVNFINSRDKFRSQCRNPFTKKQEYLGYFDCPELAHNAWRKRKHELALQLADLQTDERVAQALRTRYL